MIFFLFFKWAANARIIAPQGGGGYGGQAAPQKIENSRMETAPIKGTRDFPPEEKRIQEWLFHHFRIVARNFCFEEYSAPILESEELYTKKSGDEITNQMFNFVTKENTRVALRPEMTPSLARLVCNKGKSIVYPIKWYSIAQCWRFENLQRGRRREHYQWNMDILGSNQDGLAETELICAICTLFTNLGLTEKDVVIKVNSRELIQDILNYCKVDKSQFANVCTVIDKLDKLDKNEISAQLFDLGLSSETVTRIFELIACKLDSLKTEIESPAITQLEDLIANISAYGFDGWVEFDASIVRGLAYYTGIVFEGFDRARKLRAIVGGGRYDNLMTTYGSQKVPACGFGFGDCVIMELLKQKKIIPDLKKETDVIIIPLNKSMITHALGLCKQLREKIKVDIILNVNKLGKSFSYADRSSALLALLIAPTEWTEDPETRKVILKVMNDPEDTKGVPILVTKMETTISSNLLRLKCPEYYDRYKEKLFRLKKREKIIEKAIETIKSSALASSSTNTTQTCEPHNTSKEP